MLITAKRLLFSDVAHRVIYACSCAEKVLCEVMQPIGDRLRSVHQFVSDVQPSLRYCIVPITDPFGPAVTDPQLECIVVSDETVHGANSINVKRVEQVNVPKTLYRFLTLLTFFNNHILNVL